VRTAQPDGEHRLRLITVVRIYYFSLAILVVGWIANLVLALRRPIINWRDALSLSSLVLIFITLSVLLQARSKLKQSPDAAIKLNGVRYVLLGAVVAVAVVAFLIGFYLRR
jgi:hypothetical protein